MSTVPIKKGQALLALLILPVLGGERTKVAPIASAPTASVDQKENIVLADICPSKLDERIPIDSLPYTIAHCGHYYLRRCLHASSSFGVLINADNVTLDLEGNSLIGNSASYGIQIGTGLGSVSRNVLVRNGYIDSWNTGIFSFTGAAGVVIENIICSNNANDGMRLLASGAIRKCAATSNGEHGVFAYGSIDCFEVRATGNVHDGLHLEGGNSRIENCVAFGNGGDGIDIALGGCVLSGCLASSNQDDGIEVDDSVIVNCCARDNLDNQIQGTGNVISNTCQ